MAFKWYVVHAYSQYEKKVASAIQERVERLGMQDRFGEIIVPTEEVIEMKAGQKRKSERKFFPGYVLVQMDLDDDTWHLVKETPRVLGFIGGKADKPSPITDAEANAILQRVEAGVDQPKPKTIFEPGEMVRVEEPPQCGGTDLRALYARRTGVWSGGKSLIGWVRSTGSDQMLTPSWWR